MDSFCGCVDQISSVVMEDTVSAIECSVDNLVLMMTCIQIIVGAPYILRLKYWQMTLLSVGMVPNYFKVK